MKPKLRRTWLLTVQLVLLAVSATAVVACAESTQPPSVSSTDAPRGSPAADCVKTVVHVVLHVTRQRIWGSDLDSGQTVRVAFQQASRWVFDPGPPAAMVDGVSRTTAHDGDIFYSACFDPPLSTYLIGPEDLPNQRPGA